MRKFQGAPEHQVIMQHPIVGQRKPQTSRLAQERMVIIVFLLAALSGHTGVTHNNQGIVRDTEPQLVGWHRALINVDIAVGVVGDPAGICSSGLTLCGEDG